MAHAEAALESARETLKQKNKRRQQKVAKSVKVARKRFWFEKFHWFIAPGGYVVVSGQSAQENELIVKRCEPQCAKRHAKGLHGSWCCDDVVWLACYSGT